jgi:hypothetical protein
MSKRPKNSSTAAETLVPVAPEAVTPAASGSPLEATGLLTRSQAARVLGVSVSTVIRREQVLKPVMVKGVHLFDERVLRREVTTIRHRQAIGALGPTSGDVAASVFELLEAGVEPTQIVIRLRVPPDAVQALRAQWLDMVRNSKCQKCGQNRSVVCRACLVDVLDAPCPTCSRACRECAQPLPKGRIKCKDCGAWNAENGDGAAGDRAPAHATNGDSSGGNRDVR